MIDTFKISYQLGIINGSVKVIDYVNNNNSLGTTVKQESITEANQKIREAEEEIFRLIRSDQ